MNVKQFRADLYELLSGASTVPVVWANQSSQKPPRPYMTLFIPTPSRPLHPEESRVTETQYRKTSQREADVSMNVYGHEAIEALSSLQSRIQNEQFSEKFRKKNIAVIDVGSVRDLSALLDTAWESRAQCDMRFRWTSVEDEPVIPMLSVATPEQVEE